MNISDIEIAHSVEGRGGVLVLLIAAGDADRFTAALDRARLPRRPHDALVTADSVVITGPRPLRGRLRLPGEKGMSHRAWCSGRSRTATTRVRRLAPGDDVARTAAALRGLGVAIAREGDLTTIIGQGFDALRPSAAPIDCGNSGTTMRVLSGLLAGRPFRSVLDR